MIHEKQASTLLIFSNQVLQFWWNQRSLMFLHFLSVLSAVIIFNKSTQHKKWSRVLFLTEKYHWGFQVVASRCFSWHQLESSYWTWVLTIIRELKLIDTYVNNYSNLLAEIRHTDHRIRNTVIHITCYHIICRFPISQVVTYDYIFYSFHLPDVLSIAWKNERQIVLYFQGT